MRRFVFKHFDNTDRNTVRTVRFEMLTLSSFSPTSSDGMVGKGQEAGRYACNKERSSWGKSKLTLTKWSFNNNYCSYILHSSGNKDQVIASLNLTFNWSETTGAVFTVSNDNQNNEQNISIVGSNHQVGYATVFL